MTDKDIINSDLYWNARFAENWETCEGPRQSRFFARIAIEHLPRWLIEQLKRQSLTLADWGCAQGDGTDVWASYIDAQQIVGVDFSSVAIEQAAQRYPAIRFINEDWLAEDGDQREAFDFVFSSNTLEHFHKPYAVLHSLSSRAKKAIVLALPYKECERIDEHFFSFLPENIPLELPNGFKLVWSQVVDCRPLPCTYWNGDQVILVFANTNWVDSLRLTLSDCCIEQSDTATEIGHLTTIISERDGLIANLNQAVIECDGQIANLNLAVAERDGLIANLNQAVIECDGQIANLNLAVAERDGRLAEGNVELESTRQVIAELDAELNNLKEKILILNNSRGWKYLTALHKARTMLFPDKFLHHRGIRKLYRSWNFFVRCTRSANAKSVKQFLHYSLHYGPLTALRKTRAYLSRVEGFHAVNQPNRIYDIHQHGRSDELKAYLRDKSYAGVFVMGSRCMGWHEVFKQRPHHIADHFMESGFLVLCAMNPMYEEDFTECLRRDQENLFLVNFDDRSIWAQIIDLLAVESKAPLFYHLVGTEPGTTLEDIGRLKKSGYTIIYDYIDEVSREILPGLPDLCITRHEYLLQDDEVLIITTADNLYDKAVKHRTKNIILSPNAVRLEDWALEPDAEIPPEISHVVQELKPIVGYYGNFATWMDYDCIKKLSGNRPDLNIVMIGHDYEWGKGAFAQSKISELPNVHILPAQKYHNLKYFSRFFDVGIIPFRDYELTKSVSPVKMFEYMAQQIPIVASGLKECRKYQSCLNAEDPEDFVIKVEQALQLRKDTGYLAQLRKDAEANTWTCRGKDIQAALLKMAWKAPGKLLSIVVPTYNMEKLLPRCLDSMLPPSQLSRLEIIVVNDGSKDDSLRVVREYERRYPCTVKVVDKENGGHGSCINVGIREATGKYFKIVDADDWLNLMDLTIHINFLQQTKCDMVVTNYLRTFDNGNGELVSYSDRLEEENYPIDDFYHALMIDNSSLSYAHMHAITYRTDILKKNVIRITEKSFYVDQEYISLPQQFIKSVAFEDIVLYRYYIGRPGQSVDPDVARKRAPDNYKILMNIVSLIESLPEHSAIRQYILSIAFHHTWFYLSHSDDDKIKRDLMGWWKHQSWKFSNELNRNFRFI
jgi:glycosyltransferase involved in cell wall biosynthesis